MRITILTMGSRGDVQPYIALSQGLQWAGHDVTLCTAHTFAPLAASCGLKFAPLSADIIAIMQNETGLRAMESRNMVGFFSTMMEQIKPTVKTISLEIMAAVEHAELIITGSITLFIAQALQEWRNIPILPAYPQPILPTANFPGMIFPSLPAWVPLRGSYNRLSHHLLLQAIYQLFRRAGNAVRKEMLHLRPLPLLMSLKSVYEDKQPVLYGFSQHVIPLTDQPANIHTCGYWFAQDTAWQPPARLVDFLNAGEAPVYVGFGSMTDRQPEELTRIVVQALRRTGKRGILLSGWGKLGSEPLPDSICVVESVAHEWLFPRVAAAVHHGGAGTTAASLRAGIPTIIVPFIADQPFWGDRVQALGVGPAPIPRQKLTVDALAYAISMATGSAAMQCRASALGEAICTEDGVGTAVRWVNHYFGVRSRKPRYNATLD